MALPLLTTRATHDGMPLVHISPAGNRTSMTSPERPESPGTVAMRATVLGRIPDRQPVQGEQFRFHIDMESCIGCKCCVVACNEQNGNPATINWRRVGDVEGGSFPSVHRAHFSMGCNHCVDPTCLAGCPVDAYTKDPQTGIVLHSADTCIGCQYCTWTCSYGVPQFNPERGVVGKCDMCHGRLSLGQAPACVAACPEGALAIEIVNVAEWRASVEAASAGAGQPVGDASVSTTRVTMPTGLPAAARALSRDRVELGDAHAPLIAMTVLTQLSVGAFTAVWLANLFGESARLAVAALVALTVCAIGLAAATLHLGRPVHAYRAMKMWRRSWLSREAVLFAAFVHVAGLYAAALWFEWPGAALLGGVTTLVGLGGVVATGCIYLVPSRPSWNMRLTVVQFLLTSALLGPLVAGAVGVGGPLWWRGCAGVGATLLGTLFVTTSRRFAVSPSVELRGTATLLATTLAPLVTARLALLAIGGVLLPLVSGTPASFSAALVLTLAGELLGRYLFFVSAVPRHMAAPYLPVAGEAA